VIQAWFAIPGDLSTPTGGYEYARRLLHALPCLEHVPLPGGFPDPTGADLAETAERLAATPPDAILLVDGLALGALPVACLEGVRAPIVALVHHPLYLETGLSGARRAVLHATERAALARAARVIATSTSTAALLSETFDVPGERITVAEPGTDPAPRAAGTGAPPHLLAVGAVVPRKGYDVLVEALAGLRSLAWTLTIAGALDRDTRAVAALRAAVAAHDLTGRIMLAGAVDRARLDCLYAATDIFVSASQHEGYGMAAAEAMARGLALVTSTAGALAATVPDAAALKVGPGDKTALRAALRRMLTDTAFRTACTRASWAAGQRLPRWQDTARRVAEALRRVRGV
jgi:glycosyltransferase involved in cell wall biosynthesis